jgi:hypothetical protein
VAGSKVLSTNSSGADGHRIPIADYLPTTQDQKPPNNAVPAPGERPYRARTTDTDSEEQAGRSLEETGGSRNQRRTLTGAGKRDPGRMVIWRGSPLFEDAVSECLDITSQSGPGCSPGSKGQRPEISQFPGLFRVGSNSVLSLDCSTRVCITTQTRQLSQRTVEDVVPIEPPDGNSLRPDLITRPGARKDRAGRPTSIYTTSGSCCWGPRPSSHRRTRNVGD